MNSSLILLMFCGIFVRQSFALRCYNCTSSSFEETKGCHHGDDMDDKFLVTCPDSEPYCTLLLIQGATPQTAFTSYTRQCAAVELTGCYPIPDGIFVDFIGENCFTSCQTDKCNVFAKSESTTGPVLGGTIPPATQKTTTTRKTTTTTKPPTEAPDDAKKSSALRCYSCTSSSLQETKGCHHGDDMDDKFLVTCPDSEPYCTLLLIQGSTPQTDMTIYSRQCASVELNGCFPAPKRTNTDFIGTNCFTSCQTDKCNALAKSESTTRPVLGSRIFPETQKMSTTWETTTTTNSKEATTGPVLGGTISPATQTTATTWETTTATKSTEAPDQTKISDIKTLVELVLILMQLIL